MRLHAKLLGENPFCIFPIWLVYCTFKRTERNKYTLWTGLTSKQFGKSRVVGTLLLSLGPQGCCLPTAAHPNNQNCRNWSPSAKRSLQNMGLNIPLLYSPAGWASLAPLCKSHNMIQFYTSNVTPDNKSQELWSMAKRKPQINKTEKDARVLTSVYFLSYHSLKLLPNSIKKKTK